MRQRRKSVIYTALLAVLCAVSGRPAIAHEGDITLSELREQPGAAYQLRVDLPDELAGSVLTPTLPDRCRLDADSAPDTAASSTLLLFAFTCDDQPLTGEDSLGLPWPTAGGVVAVYWEDGTSQSQFFTADEEGTGLVIPIAELQATDTSLIPQLRQDAIAGFTHIFIAWPHLLFLLALVFWTRSRHLLRFVTVFMAGSLASVAIAATTGAAVPLIVAETSVIATAAVLALLGTRKDQAERTQWQQWSLIPIAALGLLHGLGWAGVLGWGGLVGMQLGARLLVFNLGIDAAQLLVALVATGTVTLGRRTSLPNGWQRGAGYGLAGLAIVAIALPQVYKDPSIPALTPADRRAVAPTDIKLDTDAEVVSTAPPAGDRVSSTVDNTAVNPSTAANPERDRPLPVEGFVAITPFETRTEILVNIADLIASGIITNPSSSDELAVADQEAFKQQVADAIANGFTLTVDGTPVEPTLEQVNFVTPGEAGIIIREEPIPEAIADATLGIALLHPTAAIPQDVAVEWTLFAANIEQIATTITDPQRSIEQVLTAEQPTARWENTLVDVAVPDIQAIAVSDTSRTVPLVSIGLIAIALLLDWRGRKWRNQLGDRASGEVQNGEEPNSEFGIRNAERHEANEHPVGTGLANPQTGNPEPTHKTRPHHTDTANETQKPQRTFFAATRVILPLAIWAYPLAALPLTLPAPFQPQPSVTQTTLILEQLLSNIYQSFEFRTEDEIYDKLALSVEGEQLADIYLENRRALEVENRGGARARVDQIDVTEIASIYSAPDQQLLIQAEWRVGGSVSHFGHTHYRHNLYVAAITLSYTDSVWKINRIDVIDEHRLL